MTVLARILWRAVWLGAVAAAWAARGVGWCGGFALGEAEHLKRKAARRLKRLEGRP